MNHDKIETLASHFANSISSLFKIEFIKQSLRAKNYHWWENCFTVLRHALSMNSMHIYKNNAPSMNDMHVYKNNAPSINSMHVYKNNAPSMNSIHVYKNNALLVNSMHFYVGPSYTGPYFCIVWWPEFQASLHLPHRRWSPSLVRQPDAKLNEGSGYANVVLLLLSNLGSSPGKKS